VRSLTVAVTALVVVATAVVAAITSVAPASASNSVPAMTSRSAVIAYPGCPSGAVSVTVATPRDPVPAGQTVHYDVLLRNNSPTACGPAQATTTVTGGAGLRSILLNPCGGLRVVIDDHRGEQVYPPFEAIMCPLLLPPKLAGDAAVIASLSWNQLVGGGGRPARRAHLAPRGTYRILVDNAVRARFVLAPARPSSAGRHTQAHPTVSIVTRTGHVTFEGCPTKDVVATVSVPAHPSVGSPVRYTVTLTNRGASSCGPTGVQVQPARAGLTVGPCGILPAFVGNAAGDNIYPGPVSFSCPDDSFIDIPAHSSVTATGVWPGSQALGPAPPHVSPAPPGRYRVEVGQRPAVVTLPFTLVVVATPI
jgi:hypothetical protein